MNVPMTQCRMSKEIQNRETRGAKVQRERPVNWPCCNLIICEQTGQNGARYLLSAFQSCARNAHKRHSPHTNTHTNVLSQHPQIRLHATFPIKGFLERLDPERGDISAPRVKRARRSWAPGLRVLISGGSATLIPDFHKIRG